VISFVEHLAERGALDLDACGEFLVLISSLLELKARGLFPEEEIELSELGPEEAAEELARRLAEYRRMKEAATWLAERLGETRDRFFRVGPAPLAPQPTPCGRRPRGSLSQARTWTRPEPSATILTSRPAARPHWDRSRSWCRRST